MFLLLITALLLPAIIFMGTRVLRELQYLSAAPTDNTQWVLSQLEVELLELILAANKTDATVEPTLAKTRQRFDIFYSRVDTIIDGSVARSQSDHSFPVLARAVKGVLDDHIPIMDGPDSAMATALPALTEQWSNLQDPVRSMALLGVSSSAEAADERRRHFTLLLVQTAFLAFLFVLALVIAVYRLLVQHRALSREAAENERNRGRLAAMVGASIDGIIVSDRDGTILECNAVAAAMFGIEVSEAVGQAVEDIVVPAQSRNASRMVRARFLAGDKDTVFTGGLTEVTLQRAGGYEFPAEVSIGTAIADRGTIFIAYIRDISARRHAENELREARDKALAADAAKSSFMAIMSHEMRTPLNGLIGSLELMGSSQLDVVQTQLLNTAVSASEILLHHVNDVLDIAAIEAGRIEFKITRFSLCDLMQEVLRICTPVANESGNTVVLNCAEKVPRTISSDRLRIQQILINLVGNAAKFTVGGSILVQAGLRGDQLELAVSDTGVGIDMADQERIFEKFVLLNHATGGRSGVGLGLNICRRIAEEMGGQINVSSALGEGSRFSLCLPMDRLEPDDFRPAQAEHVLVSPTSPTPYRGHVMVIEDNEANSFVLRSMLEKFSCSVVCAHDGYSGASVARDEHFDLILLDINMPGIDGFETARRIRSGGASCKTPIIAVTAHLREVDQNTTDTAEIIDWIAKPVRLADLADLLGKFIGHGSELPKRSGTETGVVALVDPTVLEELQSVLPPDIVAARLAKCASETRQGLDDMIEMFTLHRMAQIAHLAHRLKGGASVFGAVGLANSLAGIERRALGNDLSTLSSELEAAKALSERSFSALHDLMPSSSPNWEQPVIH